MRDCTFYVAKMKALISCVVTAQMICTFLFAHAKSRFSDCPAHLLYPPANCVCGWVYCFHVVRPSDRVCVCVCVCPLRFVSLITLRIFD